MSMTLYDFAVMHGAELLPPVGEERMRGFELAHGLTIPPGLRDFYSRAGGTLEFLGCIWRIWPFEEATTLDRKIRDPLDVKFLSGDATCPVLSDYIAFMDALMEAPVFAVCANPQNPAYGEVISLSGDDEQWLDGPMKSWDGFLLNLGLQWDGVPCLCVHSDDEVRIHEPH